MEDSSKDRSGRLNQRHDTSGCRLVVGTVPFMAAGSPDGDKKIILINSRKYPEEWVLPKGGWEENETQAECAAREAWEEAGCVGTVLAVGALVADCPVDGGKKSQRHTYYAMQISSLSDEWPERAQRDRIIVDITEARRLLGAQQRRKDRDVQIEAIDQLLGKIDYRYAKLL